MTAVARSGAAKSSAPAARRVAVYTRKSTSAGLEQDFNSLDAQREACEGYARAQAHLGWKLLEERYDDGGFTGANLERPAFQRLLADIEAGKVDIVIVYKVDRLSRSLLDFARVMERFGRAGAAFVSVTQNFSTADAMGRLTLNMLMSFAEFEREMIAERTSDKMCAARRRGKWTGGSVPLGYDVKEKKLVVNELEAVLVREVFALYLENRSALAVARALNARHQGTKSGHAWTKADVLRVLRSPVYGGFMGCGGEVHPGEHQAIVDGEVFEEVRALLAEHGGPRRDRGRNPEYILRGLLFCACCGAAFTPASTRRGEREYRYYRCVTRDKQGKEACPSAPLPAGAIEGYVVARLREATADGDLAAEVAESVKARVAARRRELATVREKLPAEVAALAAEAKRLLEVVGKTTGAGAGLAQERYEEVSGRLERAQARLAEAERELANLDAAEVEAGWVAGCIARFDAVWDVLTPENRARLVRAVVERVEVDEPANKVTVVLADIGDGTGATAEAGVVVEEGVAA